MVIFAWCVFIHEHAAVSFPFLVFRGVSSNDFPCLENLCKKIMKEKQPFERLEIKKETLLEMFKVEALLLQVAER